MDDTPSAGCSTSWDRAASLGGSRTLYDASREVYGLLRYGARVRWRAGGIPWHTQGSGKSLTMVWLAKWIREHVPHGRVFIVTDRTELDEQIEQVFRGVGEAIRRTRSGADLVRALDTGGDWLIASLIHKFGAAEEDGPERAIRDCTRYAARAFDGYDAEAVSPLLEDRLRKGRERSTAPFAA